MTGNPEQRRVEGRGARGRRAVRWILAVFAVPMAFGLLAVLAFLASERVRLFAFDRILPTVEKAVPGELAIGTRAWPALGEIELSDVVWTDRGDTLFHAGEVAVAARIGPLLKRDVHIDRVALRRVTADLAAIRGRFPADTTGTGAPEGERRPPAFPREGALPGAPSVAVDTLVVEAFQALLDTGRVVVREAALSGDLLKGHAPGVQVSRLEAAGPEQGWRVESNGVTAGLEPLRVDGRIDAGFHDLQLSVRVSSPRDEAIRLTVEPREGPAGTATPWGADLTVAVERSGIDVTAADLQGELRLPGTDALARYSLTKESVAGLPALEGPRLGLAGRFTSGPVPGGHVRIEIDPTGWIDGGVLAASFEGEAARLDTLRMDLPGLLCEASGNLSPDSLRARLDLSVRSAELMEILAPEATRPERVSLDLRAELSGLAEDPVYETRLTGSVTQGGQEIHDIRLTAAGRAQGAVTFTYRAVTAGLRVAGAGRAGFDDGITVNLTPIQVVDSRRPPPAPSADQATAHVRYDPRTGAVDADGLRVTGDMGELAMEAALDAGRRGAFQVAGRWPRPPSAALAELVKHQEQLDSLSVRWRRDGPFALDLAGDLDLSGKSPRILARGSFRLPGPRTLSPLLPPGPMSDSLDALGALEANLSLETTPAGGGTAFDFDFDLEPTEWLEQGRVHVVSDGRIAEIDTLGLAVDGLLFTARGRGGEELLDVEADLEVEHVRFVRRFLGEAGTGLETRASLNASLGGTPAEPDIAIRLGASGVFGANGVDTLNASARLREGRLNASVTAGGIAAGALALDEAGVSFASVADSLFPARVSLTASGPDLGVRLGGDIAAGDSVEARVDTLDLRLGKQTLANAGSFRIATPRRGSGVHIYGLRLEGSLGSLRLDGSLTDRASDCEADISVRLSEIWALLDLPPEYRPANLAARVAVTGLSRAHAEVEVRGLDLGGRKGLGASLILDTTGEDVTARLAMAAGADSVARGTASLPAKITLLPFSFVMRDEPISADVELTGLPIPIRDGDEPRHVVLDGRLLLAGTMAEPRALVVAGASLPDWPRLEEHRVRIEAELVPPGGLRTEDPSVRLLPRQLAAGAAPGAVAALRWTRADAQILDGLATIPLEIRADSLTARIPPTRPVHLKLESPRKIPLADLSSLLPPNMRTEGRVEVRLTADGKLEEADLTGAFGGEDVRFELADGSRATLQADLKFGGTTKRPSVTGKVEVTRGLIRVPEEQKQLHAVSGEALLWRTEAYAPPPSENTENGATPVEPPAPAKAETAPAIDVDVGVSIPGGLWISGRGLDVELRGNLEMQQKGTIPTVTGELSAAQGRLVFLGRSFEIDRGDAVFYGGDEINPELDLSMSTRVSDERSGEVVTVRVDVKGTAQEPAFELTSDPQMQEGDIFSLLLFGTTLDELDSEQLGLLQDRARDVAASFALVQLQEKLSRQLGVDLLTIKQGSAGQETSLVIGKYLTRRALLKYEQVLETGVEFLVNLEYSLTRHWTLETLVGPTSQSAVELNWKKAY